MEWQTHYTLERYKCIERAHINYGTEHGETNTYRIDTRNVHLTFKSCHTNTYIWRRTACGLHVADALIFGTRTSLRRFCSRRQCVGANCWATRIRPWIGDRMCRCACPPSAIECDRYAVHVSAMSPVLRRRATYAREIQSQQQQQQQ